MGGGEQNQVNEDQGIFILDSSLQFSRQNIPNICNYVQVGLVLDHTEAL